MPISTANLQDGFVGFKDGQMILMRVPYPMGFYAKGLDGRIDDPNAGWKGRGLWSASGDRTPWLNELGKGARPMAVHIQVRPDPLATSSESRTETIERYVAGCGSTQPSTHDPDWARATYRRAT